MNRLKEKLDRNKKRLTEIDKKIQNLLNEKERLEKKISLQEIELKKNELLTAFLTEEHSDEDLVEGNEVNKNI